MYDLEIVINKGINKLGREFFKAVVEELLRFEKIIQQKLE